MRTQISNTIADCHQLAHELRWLFNQTGHPVIRDLISSSIHRIDLSARQCQYALERVQDNPPRSYGSPQRWETTFFREWM